MAAGQARGEAATAEQVMVYGAVAANIRAAMTAKNWTPADFNEAMGRDRGNGGIYHWLGCKAAPGATSRAKVAKVLGLRSADLLPRTDDDGGAVAKRDKTERDEAGQVIPPPPPKRDVLTFSVDDAGNARIKVDMTLPVVKGAGLLRILLDAGLSLGAEE
jgi:hypothetical protein